MGEAIQAIGLVSGMGAFGKGLGVVGAIVVIVLLLRRWRNEEDEKRADRQAKSFDAVQADYEAERERRIAADQRVSRYLEALRIWCGFAHEQRHARMNDRQQHIMHEQRAGIDPLILPEIPALPRLTEEDEAG